MHEVLSSLHMGPVLMDLQQAGVTNQSHNGAAVKNRNPSHMFSSSGVRFPLPFLTYMCNGAWNVFPQLYSYIFSV